MATGPIAGEEEYPEGCDEPTCEDIAAAGDYTGPLTIGGVTYTFYKGRLKNLACTPSPPPPPGPPPPPP